VELQARCPSCGAPVSEDRDFCESCGAYLRWDEDEEEQTAVLTPPEVRAPPVADEPAFEPAPIPPPEPEPEPAPEEDPEELVVALRRPDGEYTAAAPIEIVVEPGGTGVLVGLVRNRSGIVDHYDLELRGVPPDWVTIEPPALQLLPLGTGDDGYEAEATMTLHPPRTCEAAAGPRQLRLVARSRSRALERESNDALARIVPFELLDARLRPARVRDKRTARFALPVRNRGNAPLVLTPRGEDDDGELSFAFDPPRLKIPPCGEARSVVTATAPIFRTGPERARNLTVFLDGAEQPISGSAVFLQEPSVRRTRLGLWRVLLTIAAAALLVAASFAHWTSSETGVCTNGPDTCLRYDTYLENHLDTEEIAAPGDLGDFTRVFNFGTSVGILTLLAAGLIVLGALTGRLAWFAGLLAMAVLVTVAVTADEPLGAGIWLGLLGATAALGAALVATAERRRA
jgi:zinc ribbon protein